MVGRDSVESNMKVTRRNQMSDQSRHVLAQPTLNQEPARKPIHDAIEGDRHFGPCMVIANNILI